MILHDARQQAGRRQSGLRTLEKQELAFTFGDATERIHVDTALLGKLRRGDRRLAVLAEGSRHRRPFELDGLRWLQRREIAHEHGETAGRGERTQLAMRQRRFGET
jgi:hypothetical protein